MQITHIISYDDSHDQVHKLIKHLIVAIEIWAGEEDNIPKEIYSEYVMIKKFLFNGGIKHQIKREF